MNWWEEAKCRDVPPDVFEYFDRYADDPWYRARQVCDGCPVQLQCLEFALAEDVKASGHDSHMFVAGMTPDQLSRLRRKAQR